MIKSHLLYQLSYAATRRGGDYGNDRARGEARASIAGVVVSAEGIEPSTYWLKASCSAD